MKLITAHKILIGSAIAFFVFYAGWELRRYAAGSDAWAIARALASAAAAGGFAWYYRTID